jgi:iron complex outermembrane receptor protein
MPSEEALNQLLAGSGLTHVAADESTVAIEQPGQTKADGATMLAPITVEGQAESAFGPVEGYVATRNSTGAKTDTAISEVPQSVSVVTRDQIEARGARTESDVLAYTAGVSGGIRGDASGLGGDNISIRGFGGNSGGGGSFNAYWDGLRVQGTNLAESSIEPYFFERFEVLRGPASVLYGQNQPGGIVNRVSKRPPGKTQGEVQLRGGTLNTKELDVDLGGPITEAGSLSYRVVGVLLDRDAQTDFTTRQRQAVAPSLSWHPTADTTLTLLATFQHDNFDGGHLNYLPAFGTISDTPNGRLPRERFSGDPNFDTWNRNAYSIGYLFDHRFNETWSVRQNLRYVRNELKDQSLYSYNLQADGRTVDRAAFSAIEHANVYTIDNQAEARFATGAVSHIVLFGVDLKRRDSDTFRRDGAAPSLDLYAPVYFQTIPEPPVFQDIDDSQHQIGVYAQDQIKLEQWILTFGGRHDWANSETTDNLAGTTSKERDSAFTGRIGLGYAFANGITPYFGFAQSFDPQSGADFSGARFEPTRGEQYEVGIKYAPVGDNAFVTLSAFNLTQENVLTADPDHPGFSVQTGEVRSRGVELEGVATLENGWSFLASYSLLDQEVTKSNGANKGKRLATIPRHKAGLWGAYAFSGAPLRGLQLGAGVRYVGGTAGDTLNTFDVPAYTLVDASLSYDMSELDSRLKGASLAINATNLTDKTYVASCNNTVTCYYGIGRTVIARLKYQW